MHKRIAVTPALPECYIDYVLQKIFLLEALLIGARILDPIMIFSGVLLLMLG